MYDQILIPALAQAECDWHRGNLDDTRHVWIRQGLREIVQTLGEHQQGEDSSTASAAAVLEAKGQTDRQAPSSATSDAPTTRPTLPDGASVNVRCLPAHDEADQIVGLMLAQVLQRRGFTVTVADTVSLASEMVASIDPQHTDFVVVSALPPKAALHARYLVKPIVSRYADLKIIAGLWNNNKVNALELNNVQTVSSLDALQDQLDQITPMILLGTAPTPVKDRDEILTVTT